MCKFLGKIIIHSFLCVAQEKPRWQGEAASRIFNLLPREIGHYTCFHTFKSKVQNFLVRSLFLVFVDFKYSWSWCTVLSQLNFPGVYLGLCKMQAVWRRMEDGGQEMADGKMRMVKCR